MNRYVKLLSKLRAMGTKLALDPKSDSEIFDLIQEATDAIEDLRIELGVSGWIRPEDRLPEPRVHVLVARPYEAGQPLRVEQGSYSTNGWWRVYGTNVKRVKYWRPMPEPPKEET